MLRSHIALFDTFPGNGIQGGPRQHPFLADLLLGVGLAVIESVKKLDEVCFDFPIRRQLCINTLLIGFVRISG